MTDTNVEHVEVYRDVSQSRWRWRAVAANGEIVSEGEAHTRAYDAERAARGVFGKDVTIVREPPATPASEPGDEQVDEDPEQTEGPDA